MFIGTANGARLPRRSCLGRENPKEEFDESAAFRLYLHQVGAWHVNAGAGLFVPAKTCPRPPAGLRSNAGSPPRVLTRGAFQEPRPRLCLPSQGAPNDAGKTGAPGFVIVPVGHETGSAIWIGNPVRAHIGAQHSVRPGEPVGLAKILYLLALRRLESRIPGHRVGPNSKNWATSGLGQAIGRAFFMVPIWSTPAVVAGFSSARAVGAGGTVRQGAIGSPDQGLDPGFWHRQRDTAWHNEVCQEVVHFTTPAGGPGTVPASVSGARREPR